MPPLLSNAHPTFERYHHVRRQHPSTHALLRQLHPTIGKTIRVRRLQRLRSNIAHTPELYLLHRQLNIKPTRVLLRPHHPRSTAHHRELSHLHRLRTIAHHPELCRPPRPSSIARTIEAHPLHHTKMSNFEGSLSHPFRTWDHLHPHPHLRIASLIILAEALRLHHPHRHPRLRSMVTIRLNLPRPTPAMEARATLPRHH